MPAVASFRPPRLVAGAAVVLALAAAGFALYGHSLHGPHYGDDLAFVFNAPSAHTLASFFERDAETFFRPLDYAFQAFVQVHLGRATWPLHLVGLALHVLLAAVVFRAALDLRMTRLQAALAASFVMVAQAAPGAVAGNDTLSQVGSAFFGALAVWLLYLALFRERRHAAVLYALSLAGLALALLSKETGAPFAVIMLGLLGLRALAGSPPRAAALRAAALRALPLVLLLAGYLLLRAYASRAEVAFGEERYMFSIGPNIAVNLAQFGLSALLPAPSVAVFEALHGGRFLLLGALLLAVLAAAVAVGVGLWRAGRPLLTALLGGCAVLALFPTVLLNHVSELYLYNALPFIALLVGLGLGALLEAARAGAVRAVLLLAVAAFYGGHAYGAWTKADLMRENGERAAWIISEITPCIEHAPPGARIDLVNSPEARLTYSVYLLPEFNVLRLAEGSVARLAGRPDVTLLITDPSGVFNPDLVRAEGPEVAPALTLTLPDLTAAPCLRGLGSAE